MLYTCSRLVAPLLSASVRCRVCLLVCFCIFCFIPLGVCTLLGYLVFCLVWICAISFRWPRVHVHVFASDGIVISVARAISKPASFASLAMGLFSVFGCVACAGVFFIIHRVCSAGFFLKNLLGLTACYLLCLPPGLIRKIYCACGFDLKFIVPSFGLHLRKSLSCLRVCLLELLCLRACFRDFLLSLRV